MSLSMFGHKTKLLLNAFIRETPGWQTKLLLNAFICDTLGWQLCNWPETFSFNFKGITTLEPHNKQPNFTRNSFFLQTNSLNFSLFSHNPQFPVNALSKTRAVLLSLLLSISMSFKCTGELSNCNKFIPKQFLSSLVLFVSGWHWRFHYRIDKLICTVSLIKIMTISEYMLPN